MVKRIIHIADIHIPNRNDERPYSDMMRLFIKDVFSEVIRMKNEEGIDRDEIRIAIVGDIFQQKIKSSNEAKSLFHELLNAFDSITRTIIVAGNHDMLENNTDRTDSITPTFEIDGVYRNIIYADKELGYKSGCIDDENILWAVYSMFDKFARPFAKRNRIEGKTIVGLYHGDVVGATTESGRMSDSGININDFIGCDCVMAGHIHKYQEIKKNGIPIVYPSSVFQQNMGENTTRHGYVIWDMEKMTHRLHEVPNNHKIYKFEINSYDDVANDIERLMNL